MKSKSTGDVRHADRNRLDRMPTRGERWSGALLSALMAMAFLPSAAFVLMKVRAVDRDNLGMMAFAGALAGIGMIGAFFFYRFAFTSPEAATPRAHRVYLVVAVGVTALMSAVTFFVPATTTQRVTSFSLLFVALAMLAGARKRGGTGQ